MKIWKIITKETEYIDAMKKVIESPAMPGTHEYEEREFLLVLIRDYEEKKTGFRGLE